LYEVHFQPHAKRDLKWYKRKAKDRYRVILERLEELEKDPQNESIELTGQEFHGLRRLKAGIDRVRLMICEDCRRDPTNHPIHLQRCSDCDDIPENGIKVFQITPRRKGY